MFDNNTCKYLIIALIIALLVMVYLYLTKKTYKTEGMNNIEHPWAEPGETQYRSVNRTNRPNKNYVKRKDELYDRYVRGNDSINHDLDKIDNEKINYKKTNENNVGEKISPKSKDIIDIRRDLNENKFNIPQPLDDRPDLSQCQPCICDRDSDSESDIIYIKAKRNKSKKNRRNWN